MEVILQSNFPTLGYVGDRVAVANGYARNFLIPRGIAIEATSHNEAHIRHLLAGINKKRAQLRADAEEFAKKMEGLILEFTLKAGEGGKIFGAVTSKDIETALKAKGVDIIRKQIRLTEQLKKAGEYKVQIKLHSEVSGTITIRMLNEGQLEKPVVEGAEGAKTEKRVAKTKRAPRKAKAESEAAPEAATEAPAKSDA